MLLKLLFLSLFSTAYSNSYCDRCLEITQTIKNSPQTLKSGFRFLHIFCFLWDKEKCNNYLDVTYNYITDNSNDNICYNSGFCPNLYGENLNIPNLWSSEIPIDIFKNGKNLMGYNASINENNLNYNLLWNITFNESIKNVDFKPNYFQDLIFWKTPNMSQSCIFRNQNRHNGVLYSFMTVRTNNFIHYFNFTNIVYSDYITPPVYLGNISSEYQLLNPNLNNGVILLTSDIIQKKTQLEIIETLKNETNLNLIYPIWDKLKFFSCYANGQPNNNCCTSEIIGIGSQIYNINFI